MAFIKTAAIMALTVMIAFVGISPAGAGPYRGYVTADSEYGNGTVSGPVRIARFGYQVKLPGGRWLYCTRSGLLSRADPCSDTLRRETVDFWQTLSDRQGR